MKDQTLHRVATKEREEIKGTTKWTKRSTEWQPRRGKRSRGRPSGPNAAQSGNQGEGRDQGDYHVEDGKTT